MYNLNDLMATYSEFCGFNFNNDPLVFVSYISEGFDLGDSYHSCGPLTADQVRFICEQNIDVL